jgi:hypothetical protein
MSPTALKSHRNTIEEQGGNARMLRSSQEEELYKEKVPGFFAD